MSSSVPFAASTQGKLAHTAFALFFALMAISGLKSAPSAFDPLFIIVTCVVICLVILSVTLSLEDYPKEALFIICAVPFAAGPLIAWTHIAGGGAPWKAHILGAIAVIFASFIGNPPKWRMSA